MCCYVLVLSICVVVLRSVGIRDSVVFVLLTLIWRKCVMRFS